VITSSSSVQSIEGPRSSGINVNLYLGLLWIMKPSIPNSQFSLKENDKTKSAPLSSVVINLTIST
jgi:hypothetical protein